MAITNKWQAHIEAWQSSGLTQADYCLQQGINVNTFTARLSDYRRQKQEANTMLIPVVVDEGAKPPEAGAIVLHCGKGHRLELPGTVSAAWLSELLRRLG